MNTKDFRFAVRTYLRQEIMLGGDEAVAVRQSPGDVLPRNGKPGGHADRAGSLESFKKRIEHCRKCHLGSTRIKFVFGVGNPGARLLFIGEGPGYDEDRQGEPFVGRAGKLLDKMIAAMDLSREIVYIANIVKCHPMKDPSNPEMRGNDRPPDSTEVQVCMPYLEEQIRIINPKVICTLGGSATQAMLKTTEGISRLRGQVFDYHGITLMPTYHPAALLRNSSLKPVAWKDLQKVRDACKD